MERGGREADRQTDRQRERVRDKKIISKKYTTLFFAIRKSK